MYVFSLSPGYGFVDFENPGDALKAVQGLQSAGVMAQFAKVPQVLFDSHIPHIILVYIMYIL